MKSRYFKIKLLLAVILSFIILSVAAPSYAFYCQSHRFDIESELTGLIVGSISTNFLVNGSPGKVICLKGSYEGRSYGYEYWCNGETNSWEFVRKLKEEESGQSCFWGKIR